MQLIEFTDKGLYCRQGNFYVDPWKPVEKAVITHAHSDHARAGSQSYLCHPYSKPILELRLGEHPFQSLDWHETVFINGVQVSLHPAGHIIGSAQVRVEYKGEVWVISGDYKLENDGISGEFEPVKCNTFISESTFGLPIYHWKPQQQIFDDINSWIVQNRENAKTSVLIAYSLGKAQRILHGLKETVQDIFVHGAIWNMHETLLRAGWQLPRVQRLTPETPKEPIAPGATAKIKVNYNAAAMGAIDKTVSIKLAGITDPKIVKITGEVLDDAAYNTYVKSDNYKKAKTADAAKDIKKAKAVKGTK
jgi:putative mRNA 3-end processing factor